MSTFASHWLRRLSRTRMKEGPRRGLVLMYHRVANVEPDPWGLCVSPSHFAEHLEVLQKRGTCLRLGELVQCLHERKLPPNAIALTFDDGYADNLHTAKPLLERYGIPATVFLTTGYLGTEREFWWDELERLLLEPGRLPEQLRLTIDGKMLAWSLDDSASYSEEAFQQHRYWRTWEEAPSKRHAVYSTLWETLYKLRHDAQQHVLSQLRHWAGASDVSRSTHSTLSSEDVTALAHADLISVGAHTITHPALALHPPSLQQAEIEKSKRHIQELLDRPVSSFSYPHGHYSPETVSLVRETGFTCACSTAASPVKPLTDCFQLPRMQVLDWDGDAFEWQLSAWLSENSQNS